MDKSRQTQYRLFGILLGSILVIDQIVKIMVKTHMHIGEEIPLIGNWCLLNFTENNGFAFGISLGEGFGKILLSVFRLVASGALMWYMFKLIKKGTSTSVVGYLTLILAGAIGNLIDSCFYGIIFNESTYQVAHLFPSGGGYAPFMQGKVVDMFYFPLFQFTWPEWVPFVGGTSDVFFNAIFNVADASITIGAIWLIVDLLFFADKRKEKNEASVTINDKKTVSNPQKS